MCSDAPRTRIVHHDASRSAAELERVARESLAYYAGTYSSNVGRPDGVIDLGNDPSSCRGCGAPWEPIQCSYCKRPHWGTKP